MLVTNSEDINSIESRPSDETHADNLSETIYCNYSHPAISELAGRFLRHSSDTLDLVDKIFLFVRDTIAFGGDHWQVKASETLLKGYGACFNKNILMISLLRSARVPAKLMANPLKNSFTKPSVGAAHILFSNPFYHCFTRVLADGHWIAVDPTLDRKTYEAFFKPAGVSWQIDWDRKSDMLLYSESLAGPPREFNHIDEDLDRNLDSYFVFRHEPRFIRSLWLRMGNRKMWRKTKRLP